MKTNIYVEQNGRCETTPAQLTWNGPMKMYMYRSTDVMCNHTIMQDIQVCTLTLATSNVHVCVCVATLL